MSSFRVPISDCVCVVLSVGPFKVSSDTVSAHGHKQHLLLHAAIQFTCTIKSSNGPGRRRDRRSIYDKSCASETHCQVQPSTTSARQVSNSQLSSSSRQPNLGQSQHIQNRPVRGASLTAKLLLFLRFCSIANRCVFDHHQLVRAFISMVMLTLSGLPRNNNRRP